MRKPLVLAVLTGLGVIAAIVAYQINRQSNMDNQAYYAEAKANINTAMAEMVGTKILKQQQPATGCTTTYNEMSSFMTGTWKCQTVHGGFEVTLDPFNAHSSLTRGCDPLTTVLSPNGNITSSQTCMVQRKLINQTVTLLRQP